MAVNDVTLFNKGKLDFFNGIHDLDTHSFKLAIFESALNPTASDAAPVYSTTNEVTAAGTYIASGVALVVDLKEVGGTITLDFTNNPTWAQDAANTATAYWGLIYNDTNIAKEAFAFVDLGGPVDMTAGPLTINWNDNGLFQAA